MINKAPHILYLVHDLSDAAVAKRIIMLQAGGAVVTVAGFRRTNEKISQISEAIAIDLGQTYNGGFIQRVAAVLRETALLNRHSLVIASADIIIARNLEMLAIGVKARSLSNKLPVLVYESLDIHRLLLSNGFIGKTLRGLEGWLSKRASALITSSPAFVKHYFESLSSVHLPIILVENKVYDPGFIETPELAKPRLPGPVWRIGWYGIIRCKKSFAILSQLVNESCGSIEVVISGKPALDQIPDFHDVVNATPGLNFTGPYKNPEDLQAMYRSVHFTWAIDMFEEGLNSSWLLPNRLYEGGLYNTVPLARDCVETGLFLKRLGNGIILADPLPGSLQTLFKNLDAISYQNLEKTAMEIPRSQWLLSRQDCVAFVNSVNALRDRT